MLNTTNHASRDNKTNTNTCSNHDPLYLFIRFSFTLHLWSRALEQCLAMLSCHRAASVRSFLSSFRLFLLLARISAPGDRPVEPLTVHTGTISANIIFSLSFPPPSLSSLNWATLSHSQRLAYLQLEDDTRKDALLSVHSSLEERVLACEKKGRHARLGPWTARGGAGATEVGEHVTTSSRAIMQQVGPHI
jgi:hypothetical protein